MYEQIHCAIFFNYIVVQEVVQYFVKKSAILTMLATWQYKIYYCISIL